MVLLEAVGASSVVDISRPMENPMPSAPRRITITGAAIAQKRHAPPMTRHATKKPARTIQPMQISVPPI